ncbi:MAG: nuclear transport factor 2 family protein [Hamadaea sp.]|nr:nuclear transport factor 2 family protein [Hamadaea sp.]NUT23830.1 nuclear transport factor 2 family protein [Hamadaea sp.]
MSTQIPRRRSGVREDGRVDTTEETRRTALDYVESLERRDWPRWEALIAEDVVYELPQSRERIRGRAKFLQFNVEYPGDWHLDVRRVVADRRNAALWLDVRVGDDHVDACVWLEIGTDGAITKVTDYWPEAYDPPAGREHLAERY